VAHSIPGFPVPGEQEALRGRLVRPLPRRKIVRTGAETADRPGRNFQRPDAVLIDAKLRVDWSMGQAQCSHGILRAFLDGVLNGFRKP